MKKPFTRRRVLIIVENLPVPFDRRVWQEARTLFEAGYEVSIICPTGKGYNRRHEEIDGIAIYRHPLPVEGTGPKSYLLEYCSVLWWEFFLSLRVLKETGFDVIHACNPPDNIFLIGLFYKLFRGAKFVFDHHDINPELYLAKFGRKDIFYKLILFLERLTFSVADISIATNYSYKSIAVSRGKMPHAKVHVVRSGPDLDRVKRVPKNDRWKRHRRHMVAYVGVMGQQEGLDLLLDGIAYLVHELRRHDVQFVLVGGGTELENLKILAHELKVDNYVTFTGRAPDKILMEILSTADVCVNSDVVNEMNDKSTMNKIMEYMAIGKPIVQFDMTEGRFSAQEASLYAEPNNPKSLMQNVLVLLDDSDRRKRMGEFGRNRVVNELQWKFEKPKLLKAYEDIFAH